MKDYIKSKEPQERQGYVPASVKVIEVTAQRVLCESGFTETVWSDDQLD